MKIKDYIKELLFTNQGVIIPGLGGFVSEYEPAVFDVNENKFLPPSKRITFKSEYSYHDNLLIDFISEKESIDKEKSKSLVNDFVNILTEKLKKGEKVEFPEIGNLTQISKGKILFKQYANSNFLTDSFGLKRVKTSPIVPVQGVNREIPAKTKKAYKKPVLISTSVILFLCLVGLSWFLTEGYTNFSLILSDDDNRISSVKNIGLSNAKKNLDSISRADSIKALINRSIDENTDLKDALFYQESIKESTVSATEDPGFKYSKFQIIAGSFKKIENAEKFSSELRTKGFQPKIIHSGENLYRICIYTHTDEIAALKELYRLRVKSNIESVWILKSM